MGKGNHSAGVILGDTLGNFAELVAEGTPTPGGGSVAAYSGLLATALGRMMCNLTIGKKKYGEKQVRIKEINSELEMLGDRLRELIDEDAAAFDEVLAAYRLPRDTEEEQKKRNREVVAATLKSIRAPSEVSERALEVLRLLVELAGVGNTNVFPDLTTGAQLAAVAMKGSYYNITVNLKILADDEEVRDVRDRTVKIIADAADLASAIETEMLKYMTD